MQFKVPQKIDIEDRILGPLTMVQFVYAVLGAGGGYIVLTSFPSPFGLIFSSPIFIFTFCIAFVKINGHPFGHFLKNLVSYIANPKTRLWKKGDSNIQVEIYQPNQTKVADPYANKKYSQQDFDKLAEVLDKRGRQQ